MDKASKGRSVKRRTDGNVGTLAGAAESKPLLALLEAEIIPRLMLAHRTTPSAGFGAPAIRTSDVEAFARALLERTPHTASMMLDVHRARGVPLEDIYLALFAPAARYLGELWEADLCNFSQVTLCLWRLQSLVHSTHPSFHAHSPTVLYPTGERRILLATLPAQQHTFGLSIVSEFFRRDGWIVLSVPAPEPGEILGTLAAQWFDVLGLSGSSDGEVDDLRRTIAAARKTSRNPRLTVMVGGPLFLRHPTLAADIGADGMSVDAPGAVRLAGRLVQMRNEVRMN